MMNVKFKNGPNPNHFSALRAGDVFMAAEQAYAPAEKRIVFMKIDGCDSRINAVRLSDGDCCIVPAKSPVIKVEAELSVVF